MFSILWDHEAGAGDRSKSALSEGSGEQGKLCAQAGGCGCPGSYTSMQSETTVSGLLDFQGPSLAE